MAKRLKKISKLYYFCMTPNPSPVIHIVKTYSLTNLIFETLRPNYEVFDITKL